jgi:hypothetical protein
MKRRGWEVAPGGRRGGLRPGLELDPRLERIEPDHPTILYLFGSSTIRGFAFVLIIGVLVSMFSAIVVTRSILRWVVTSPGRKASLYGVTEEEFVAAGVSAGRTRLRGEARSRV